MTQNKSCTTEILKEILDETPIDYEIINNDIFVMLPDGDGSHILKSTKIKIDGSDIIFLSRRIDLSNPDFESVKYNLVSLYKKFLKDIEASFKISKNLAKNDMKLYSKRARKAIKKKKKVGQWLTSKKLKGK